MTGDIGVDGTAGAKSLHEVGAKSQHEVGNGNARGHHHFLGGAVIALLVLTRLEYQGKPLILHLDRVTVTQLRRSLLGGLA